jgi:hypothetical protein
MIQGHSKFQKLHPASTLCICLAAMIALSAIVPAGRAQCPTLTPDPFNCSDTTGIPVDMSITFNEPIGWWSVVGVVPYNVDDKDVHLYTGCGASGTYLAGSSGVNGPDFIVCDFNVNPMGTYYPRFQYGSPTETYQMEYARGSRWLTVSQSQLTAMGGCKYLDVYDVRLQAGAEYEFRLETWVPNAGVALFRNPGSGAYWAGRSASEFEIINNGNSYYYAPADGWYGVVFFAPYDPSFYQDAVSLEVEKLLDCIGLESNLGYEFEMYHTIAGPKNDFEFGQITNYWSVVAVLPSVTDYKSVLMYTDCDNYGTYLAGSGGVTGDCAIVVADFNHTPAGNYFPSVAYGNGLAPYTIEWEMGSELFPVPAQIWTDINQLSSPLNIVKIWDVYLEAGKQYKFSFTDMFMAEPHLALFRNPSTGTYWGGRTDAEWEISGVGDQLYSPPVTDLYGLVAFADKRGEDGVYSVTVQEMNDCVGLPSNECVMAEQWPKDFSFSPSGAYWAGFVLIPADEDAKALYVNSLCDQEGTTLANSSISGTNFVVGDFNHTPIEPFYYAFSYSGDIYAPYMVACDVGSSPETDIFPINEMVTGGMEGEGGDCGRFKIWDVFLMAGQTYWVSLTQSGKADIRLSLFKNPGNGTYWASRADCQWELAGSQNFLYTPSVTDWYGLVVFANRYNVFGSYTIRFTPTGLTGTDTPPVTPERYALYQNAPNPFNPSTLIRFDVPADGGNLNLKVYDVRGQLIRTLVDSPQSAGEKSISWDGRNDAGTLVPSGVYFYRLETEGFSETRKMLLMK